MSNLDFENMPMADKRKMLEAILGDPTVFPDSFKNWLPNYLGVNPPDINVDQITGYSENTIQQDVVSATASTNSELTYVSLGGPELDGLSDGKYSVSYGAVAYTDTAGIRAKLNVSVNGAAPSDTATPQAYTWATNAVGIGVAGVVITLNAGSGNSLEVKYAVGTGGAPAVGTFDARYLSATRISN